MGVKRSISELPTSTVKLITATQIATSVSNIVKELIENSLDASSTIIRVKLENSGLSKIEITDNGSGVSKDDVLKMALPHYTSKISCHEDLESLVTYGFRGEALAAVCAIGKLSVTTKTSEDPVAFSYTMDSSGNVVDSKPSHLSQGTQISVSSLFWNLPVRKQYYQTAKRKKEEVSKVEDLLLSYGLIHPELHLSFHHDSTLIWQKTRIANFKANVIQTLGHSICSNMEFIEEEDPFRIFMMFPKRTASLETCFRQKTERCFVFINERPVIYKEIEKLMRQLYGSILEANQKSSLYPIFLLSLHVPSGDIDVNLEPNKTQVLLRKQAAVLELIKERITLSLGLGAQHEVVGLDIPVQKESDISLKSGDGAVMLVENREKERNVSDLGNATSVVDETQASDDAHHSVSRKSSLEITINEEIFQDDELFYGFNEPFLTEINPSAVGVEKDQLPSSNLSAEAFPAVGSEDWAKGWVRGPDGNYLHPVQVLRGEPHFAKRISEPLAPGSSAKKARLDDSNNSFDASQSLTERVNNCTRKLASDPFGEYCREKKNELLARNPTMSFTELSQQLSQGWKNLGKKDRENYSVRAGTPGKQFNANRSNPPKMVAIRGNMSLERFLAGQQTPVIRTSAPRNDILTKTSCMTIDFSFELLSSALDSKPSNRAAAWICVNRLESGGWLCSNGEEIMAVNFMRLFEMILYTRLANEYVIPSKPVTNPFSIDARTLKTQKVWDVLTNLPSEFETPTTSIITDPRIVANGLKLQIISDPPSCGVKILGVPAIATDFDIGDIMKLLLKIAKDGSTVENCRPDQIVKFLEEEAARLASIRCTEPDSVEVSTLLEQWLSGDPENVCLHGEPIVWSFLIGSSERNESSVTRDNEESITE